MTEQAKGELLDMKTLLAEISTYEPSLIRKSRGGKQQPPNERNVRSTSSKRTEKTVVTHSVISPNRIVSAASDKVIEKREEKKVESGLFDYPAEGETDGWEEDDLYSDDRAQSGHSKQGDKMVHTIEGLNYLTRIVAPSQNPALDADALRSEP
jgi:hypothetical protein